MEKKIKMNITHRTDKSILYIAIEGRIDASNASAAEEQISAIKNDTQTGVAKLLFAQD